MHKKAKKKLVPICIYPHPPYKRKRVLYEVSMIDERQINVNITSERRSDYYLCGEENNIGIIRRIVTTG